MTVYDYKVLDAQSQTIDLSAYRGKVLLIVNTASQCGLTPQYAGLQKLYSEWRDQGLEILAFPCDQFGHQEPGTNDEIQTFCQRNFGVTFPVFAKIEVNGEGAHPLYRYLTQEIPGPQGCDIQWNFTKFLIDRQGRLVKRFEPPIKPEDIVPAVERFVGEMEGERD